VARPLFGVALLGRMGYLNRGKSRVHDASLVVPSEPPKPVRALGRLRKVFGIVGSLAGVRSKSHLRYSEHGASTISEEEARALFVEFDLQGHKCLNFREMCECLRTIAMREGNTTRLTMEQLEAAIKQADRHDNNRVTEEDFVAWLPSFVAAQRSAAHPPPMRRRLTRSFTRTRSIAPPSVVKPGMGASASTKAVPHDVAGRSTLQLLRPENASSMSLLAGRTRETLRPEERAASKAKVSKLLRLATRQISEDHHRKLSDMFVAASSGDRFGIHRAGSQIEVVDFEHKQEMAAKGQIDRIAMRRGEQAFSRLCVLVLGVDSRVLHGSFFRVLSTMSSAREGHGEDDEGQAAGMAAEMGQQPEHAPVTFQAFIERLTPLLMGTLEQRAAFLFRLYDVGDDGAVDPREFFQTHSDLPVDNCVERDLSAFYNNGCEPGGVTKLAALTFDHYLQHVELHGECGLAMELVERLNKYERSSL